MPRRIDFDRDRIHQATRNKEVQERWWNRGFCAAVLTAVVWIFVS